MKTTHISPVSLFTHTNWPPPSRYSFVLSQTTLTCFIGGSTRPAFLKRKCTLGETLKHNTPLVKSWHWTWLLTAKELYEIKWRKPSVYRLSVINNVGIRSLAASFCVVVQKSRQTFQFPPSRWTTSVNQEQRIIHCEDVSCNVRRNAGTMRLNLKAEVKDNKFSVRF